MLARIDSKGSYTYPCLPVGISGTIFAVAVAFLPISGIFKEPILPRAGREKGRDTNAPAHGTVVTGGGRDN